MNVNDIGLRIEMIIPHVFKQHCPRDDLARMFHQIFEQAEFPRLQRNVLAVTGELVGKAVKL